jgi:hypothetical protein
MLTFQVRFVAHVLELVAGNALTDKKGHKQPVGRPVYHPLPFTSMVSWHKAGLYHFMLQTILDHMDWTEIEKEKIWVAACGSKSSCASCNLTFEQFKALITDEGGYDLPSRVHSSAVALAATASGGAQPRPLPSVFFEPRSTQQPFPSLPDSGNTEPFLQEKQPSAAQAASPHLSWASQSSLDSEEDQQQPALLRKRTGGTSTSLQPAKGSLRGRLVGDTLNKTEPAVPTTLPLRSKSTAQASGSPVAETPMPQILLYKSCPAGAHSLVV